MAARLLTGSVFCLLAAALTGCASDAGAADSADPASHSATSGSATRGAAACTDVPADVLAQIGVGTVPGTRFDVTDAVAVQDRAHVYVVAARFPGAQGDDAVGVWTVTSLTGRAAPVLVVNQAASVRTSWTRVEEFPQYGVPVDSPSIAAALDCLDG